jgi:PAS domain S-box-containing protein
MDPAELRADADSLLRLLSAAPIVIFALDRDGRFLFGEGRGLEALGLTPHEWLGRSVFDVYADSPDVVEACRKALAGEEFTAVAREGAVWFQTRYAPLRDADGSLFGTVGVSVDVTGRKPPSRPRARARSFLALAERAPDMIYELDAEGAFLYASPASKKVFGRPAHDLVSRNLFDLTHPEEREAARRSRAETRAALGARHYRGRILLPDGGVRWIEGSGRFYLTRRGEQHSVGIMRDVTEGEEARLALERQLELARGTADLSQRLLAASTDDRSSDLAPAVEAVGRLAAADYALLLTFGDAHGARNERFEWSAVERARIESFAFPWLARRLFQGETVAVDDARELPPEAALERDHVGRREIRAFVSAPLRFEAATIGALSVATREPRRWRGQDVAWLRAVADLFQSALRRQWTEQALRARQAQSLRAQKMEAVGRLAGGIAHDFNNLLLVIAGNAGSLAERLDGASPERQEVSEIQLAAERAAALTRQLLAFARPSAVTRETFDPNSVVEGVSALLRRVLGEDVRLVLDLDPALWSLSGDPSQLEQVIVNLAVNARDAMSGGGTLRIATLNRELRGRAAFRLNVPEGQYVMLSVNDTGSGMDEGTRARAFEPFFSTKAQERGTGLGLSIVYEVVREWGGAIELESAPDRGTTVRVDLPRSRERAPARAQDAPPLAPGSGTVLLVEDDPAVRRLLVRTLDGAGYRVLAAEGAEQALALVEGPAVELDLLVSDVVMPEVSGRELARRLRAKRPGLRVLLVSGFPEHVGAPGGEVSQADGFLQKPFVPRALLDKVREVLARETA